MKLILRIYFLFFVPIISYSQDISSVVSAYYNLDTLEYKTLIESAIVKDYCVEYSDTIIGYHSIDTLQTYYDYQRAEDSSNKKIYILRVKVDFDNNHNREKILVNSSVFPFNIVYYNNDESITYYLYTYDEGVDEISTYAINPITPFFPFRHNRDSKHKQALRLILDNNPDYIMWPENYFDTYLFTKNNLVYAVDVLNLRIYPLHDFLYNYNGYNP